MNRRPRLPPSLCWLVALVWLVIPSRATTASPSSIDQRERVAEALCVVIQSLEDFQLGAAAGELEVIHTEETILHSALSVLLKEASAVEDDQRPSLVHNVTGLSRLVSALHLTAHAGDVSKTAAEVGLAMEAFETVAPLYDTITRDRARELAARYTCAMHASIEGRHHDPCPRCGMALDQRMRPTPFQPGQLRMPAGRVKAAIDLERPLEPGRALSVRLDLSTLSNEPVALKDLRETHTQKIHLLIIDPLLSDYHHEHPVSDGPAGSFRFTFTPQTEGPYRVWVDLRTVATGFQEYVPIDIGKFVPATIAGDNLFRAQVDGLQFDLLFSRQAHLKAGLPVNTRIRVSRPDGSGFDQLEPVMAAFAHIVGFGDDGKTILHLHPKGRPIRTEAARGGPDLDFVFYTSTPGFVRLFVQVQVGGKSIFAPFSLNVHPREMPDELCTPLPSQ